MTALVIYIAVAAGLLLLLLLAALPRAPRAEGSAHALLQARHALRTLQVGLLPEDLVERFFARSDFEYVRAAAPPAVAKLFLEERKRILLAWLNQVRLQTISLQHFHFGHSRHFVQLSLKKEIALALEFAALRARCRMLYLLVSFRGPYGAAYGFEKTAASAARVCAVSERALAFLAPAESHALAGDSSRGGAAS
jgi:hypothetical protein